MKVVSMVPSWTETLMGAGIDVVGRTRFCIHPHEKVASIPIVGGTKDLQLDKLAELQADLFVLDQEENLQWMKEQSPIPVHVTHVTSVESVALEIEKLSARLNSETLQSLVPRWQKVAQQKKLWDWERIPGEIKALPKRSANFEKLVYVIWKKPWMSVSSETFIGSVLTNLGASQYLPAFEKKYPEFQLEDFDLEKTYFLFSSEPFPFHKKIEELRRLGVQGSIVDGEAFSWFGSRALEFLEKNHSSAT